MKKFLGILAVALLFASVVSANAEDEKYVTTLTARSFSSVVVLQFRQMSPDWIDQHFTTEDQRKTVRNVIKGKEGRGLFVVAGGDGYFFPSNIQFVQGYSAYSVNNRDILPISDNFSGKMVEGTMAMGIIFIPDRIDLSEKVEVLYDDSREVLNVAEVGTPAVQSKPDRLNDLKKRKDELEREYASILAQIAELEGK